MTTSPILARVEIINNDRDGITVQAVWDGVDRPTTHGYGLLDTPSHRKLALRLKAAIEAGVVYPDPKIAVDNFGQTYVQASAKVMGKYMNADLKRLGF